MEFVGGDLEGSKWGECVVAEETVGEDDRRRVLAEVVGVEGVVVNLGGLMGGDSETSGMVSIRSFLRVKVGELDWS